MACRPREKKLILNIDHCEFPEDLFYDVENNVWFQQFESGTGKMVGRTGISTILLFLAGKITGVKFRSCHEANKGQSLASIETIRYFGAVRSPVKGRVLRFNETLLSEPSRISKSPYETWIAEFESFDVDSLHGLLFGLEAKEKLLSRIKDLRIRCFKLLPDEEMYSIGSECTTTLANLSELLANKPKDYVVHLVTDDATADIEMVRWSMQTGNELVESRKEENLYHFIVKKIA
jgi:glycine cleavage system H protein